MMRTIKTISFVIATLISFNCYSLSPDPKAESIGSNPLFLAMGILAAVLLFVIMILSGVLRTAVKTKIREIVANKGTQAIFLLMVFFTSSNAFAQSIAPAVPESIYESDAIAGMHPLGFYSLFTVLLLELFVILWLCLIILRIIVKREAVASQTAGEKVKKESFLSNFISRKLLGVKPVETDKDVMLDHDYDGIKELDNDLPPWWKYGFYLTIIAGIIYFISYHVTHNSKSSLEEYEYEMAEAEKTVNAYKATLASNVDETNAMYAADADKIVAGKAIFVKNCVVCHGNEGQGLVGPNFADKYWVYGNKAVDLFKIVKNGTNKGMKAWKDELSPVDIQNVISYIHTLEGTNPANPKAPDGVLIEDALISNSDTIGLKDSIKVIEVQ
jgi:cytochrome c oxidase cbb3-type subunit 3